MKYYLGTSGWSYPDWRGKFYPEDLAQKNWLPFYAQHFQTVEVNMTFYRFPKPETLKIWLEKTPPQFTFTLKANRQITHRKKCREVKSDVNYFTMLADSLGTRLGCILFQLPPSITYDLDLLRDFLSTLSPSHKNVLEFRHPSWHRDDVFNLLRTFKAIFCVVSSPDLPDTVVETAETSYFRFHGRVGWYKYNYSDEELSRWAGAIKQTQARECYIYFNNDYKAYAVSNALKLASLLQEKE